VRANGGANGDWIEEEVLMQRLTLLWEKQNRDASCRR
jgi:hypothetical protein